jgi:hypothetical protein
VDILTSTFLFGPKSFYRQWYVRLRTVKIKNPLSSQNIYLPWRMWCHKRSISEGWVLHWQYALKNKSTMDTFLNTDTRTGLHFLHRYSLFFTASMHWTFPLESSHHQSVFFRKIRNLILLRSLRKFMFPFFWQIKKHSLQPQNKRNPYDCMVQDR